jgi:integrase
MQAEINITNVDLLKAGKIDGNIISDTKIKGFNARLLDSGSVTFIYRYVMPGSGRGASKKQLSCGVLGIDGCTVANARNKALRFAGQVADNKDPKAERDTKVARTENTVDHVLDEWLAKYANGAAELRSADAVKAIFKRHVRPAIGKKPIYDVTRADIVKMLDTITDEGGPVAADRTLAHVKSAFNWWRVRDDEFITMPIVKGMMRTTTKQRKRERALDEQEIRDVWRALDELGENAPPFFPAFVHALLLLGCRRDEVAGMHTDEFKGDDWIIPAARYKTKKDHLLPLPATVKAMLSVRKDGFVFSSDKGKTRFSGYSKAKLALDRTLAQLRKREGRKPMPAWQFRDLRRTARTGIRGWIKMDDEIAKRVLGHVVPGVDGVYNVYDYRDEKAEALQKWAVYIAGIVAPTPETPDNVITFGKNKSAARSPSRPHRNVAG